MPEITIRDVDEDIRILNSKVNSIISFLKDQIGNQSSYIPRRIDESAQSTRNAISNQIERSKTALATSIFETRKEVEDVNRNVLQLESRLRNGIEKDIQAIDYNVNLVKSMVDDVQKDLASNMNAITTTVKTTIAKEIDVMEQYVQSSLNVVKDHITDEHTKTRSQLRSNVNNIRLDIDNQGDRIVSNVMNTRSALNSTIIDSTKALNESITLARNSLNTEIENAKNEIVDISEERIDTLEKIYADFRQILLAIYDTSPEKLALAVVNQAKAMQIAQPELQKMSTGTIEVEGSQ